MNEAAAYPRRFGAYALACPLGVGKMGRVSLGVMGTSAEARMCVIKTLRSELLADVSARARAAREAEIARRLCHDAIAKTFAVGEQEGVPFLVQEYVDGWPLSRLIKSCEDLGRWPSPALACHMVREVARALGYVHRFDGIGVIHRDIAPSNVMISFDGEVKLIDFGIAKMTGRPKDSTILGRYTYGPPEQLQGRTDRRSDLYALGVVLWSLLAHESDPDDSLGSRRPAPAMDDATTRSPPLPSTFNEEVPGELDSIVMRALSYLPEDRYQSAEAFGAALERFVPTHFDGAAALRAFFRQHTLPEEERIHTANLVRRAAVLLGNGDGDERTTGSAVEGPSPMIHCRDAEAGDTWIDQRRRQPDYPVERSRRRVFAVVALVLLGLAVGIIWSLRVADSSHSLGRPIPVREQRWENSQRSVPAPAPVVSPAPVPIHQPPAQEPIQSDPPRTDRTLPRRLATATGARKRSGVPEQIVDKSGGAPAPAPTVSTDEAPSRDQEDDSPQELVRIAEIDLADDNLAGAVEVGRRAVAAGGGASAHLVIGNALMMQRRFGEAEREFRAAAALEPQNALARKRLREALDRLAQLSSAAR